MLKTVSDWAGSVWMDTSPTYHEEEMARSSSVTEDYQLNKPKGNDSDPIISDRDFKIAHMAIECGMMHVLGYFGLPANIINMVVFYRQGLRDKMNLCLFALAFVDFMSVFFIFFYTMYCPANLVTDPVSVDIFKWNTARFTFNFRYAFLYSSGVLTAIIATERCICVVWPLKAATIFKTQTMAWMILGIIVVVNILCLPHALKHVVRVVTDESGNVTVIYDDTDMYKNNKLAFQVVRDGILPTISFLTFFVVFFVTVVTVRKLRTAMDWRQKTSSQVMDKRQMTLVKILITVSCVYIACNTPSILLAIMRFSVPGFSTLGKYRNMIFVSHALGFVFLMVNSSVNIFIYYGQSSRFRKELQACFCCTKNQVVETSGKPTS